jgi:amino acid adenylation domain-containing protein
MTKEIIEGFRLSPQQERLWRLQQEEGASPSTYRTQCAVVVRGRLDVERLAAAIEDVILQHEILRTTFHHPPGITTSLQTVGDGASPALTFNDLSKLDAAQQSQTVDELFHELGCLPFDLEQGPTMLLMLARLSAEEHRLFVALPALCADKVALDNLIGEIGRAYGVRAGAEEPDAGEATPYIIFAEWQNELLESEDAEVGKEFWRTEHEAAPANFKLPFERETDDAAQFTPQVLRTRLTPALVKAIDTVAKSDETTCESFMLACWQALLGRLTAQAELVVAVNCDGRSDEELAKALGLFAKYLPVRNDVAGETRFSELLAASGEKIDTANEWQECFTWDLIEGRAEAKQALNFFPCCFEFAAQPAAHSAGDVSFNIAQQYACTDRFKIKLCCLREGETVSAEIHFDAAVFEAHDVKRLAAHYHKILESAAASPETALGQLEILSEAERRQVLSEFNRTEVEFPQDKRLHRLFEAQAERTPDHVAVIFEGEELTYSELNTRANQLAHYLRGAGVAPESLVGLCVERSVEMVVGMLGILKAGGAYVPIDPAYPKERIGFILQDAQPALVLTGQRSANSLPEGGVPLLRLDDDWQRVAAERTDNIESGVEPENLAYVIFTSGSTGRPKGVMIAHRSICNRLLWMQAHYPLDETDRLLQKTSISFDASVWELFVPLMSGATLIVARPGGHQDSAYLVEKVIQQKVTTLQLVPSMLQVFLDEPEADKCTSLKRMYCGGEALTGEMQAQFYAVFDARLHNLYGPTEVAIDASHWECQPEDGQRVVPIGRPLDNVQVYLLDSFRGPVPVGLPGEVYVGGVGLARGYLKRPDLTAEKFIPDPFSAQPGAWLYRTGDLGRHRPDGTVEFLGRVDHQVKVRGFRIELGEIETTLERHPAISRAVAVAQPDGSGLQRLVAYVLPVANEEPNGSDLRAYLEESLPEYMVPSAFVTLDKLPLMPNGKVDRNALPRVDASRLGASTGFVAPRNAIEELLAGMWAEILHVEQIGIHDNFFDLGGHSLLAVRLNSRLRSTFKTEVPLNLVFETPTVAGLSATISRLVGTEQGIEEAPIVPVTRERELPLSFAQQRLWFLHQLEPDNPVYNIPIAVRLTGTLDVPALERALNEIVRRHEVLRTNYSSINGRPVQVIRQLAQLELPLTKLDLLDEAGRWAEVERTAKMEASRPFDLSEGLPVRGHLLRLGETEHVLLFTIHHIASDAWSMGIVVHEFAALYEAFHAGEASPLEELAVQYADYAVWQREWLHGEVLEAQLRYWREQLAGSAPVLELPTDRPRPPVQTYRGAKEPFAVSSSLFRELGELSRKEDATLFMTLLAAFQSVLHYHTRQEDINLGSNIAGRNRLATESLIGFFINLLVMRTNLAGDPAFRELLARVRETAIGAYTHPDIPFDKLVEELQPPRDPTRTPLVQVVFDFVSHPTPLPQLSGLTLRALPLGEHFGKFDLVLNIEMREQGLEGALQYNTDLFDAATVTRLLKHFDIVLRKVVENRNIRLSALDEALAEADREQQRLERAGFKEMRRKMLKNAKQKDAQASASGD